MFTNFELDAIATATVHGASRVFVSLQTISFKLLLLVLTAFRSLLSCPRTTKAGERTELLVRTPVIGNFF